MRTRALLAALALVGAVAAACGGDGEDTDGAPDGGSNRTVTSAAFISAADDACVDARGRVDALEQPLTDPTDPNLTPEQMSKGAAFVEQAVAILEQLVAELDDMPQPADESDARAANEVIDDLGAAIEALRGVGDAARDQDASALAAAWSGFTDDQASYSRSASDLGLEECGRDGL